VIDILTAARALLPDTRLEPVEALNGGTSAQLQRVIAHGTGAPLPLIVKAFASAGEGCPREAAGLSVLGGHGLGPRLVAVSDREPVVVMTDLGQGPSLADRLLADDAAAAGSATLDWAAAIAGVHRATRGKRDEFREALDRRAGELPIATHTMPVALADAAAVIDARCASLGVAVPSGAMDALRSLAERLPDTEHAALSPTDACPDNNVAVGDRLVLVDFEGAEFRHIAWDVAYLSVPWPSCWCSWLLPDDVASRAREHYRAIQADALPYVATDRFLRDVDAAAAGWAFVSTSSLLAQALADDPAPTDRRQVRPTRRAMILHRLGRAAASSESAPLAELAVRLRERLVAQWGEVPLALAPAFRRPEDRRVE
jgi:hypothetical protein